MIRFVEFYDQENPNMPQGQKLAKALNDKITQIEKKYDVNFVTLNFVGEPGDSTREEEAYKQGVPYDKVYKFVLFFR